MKKKWSNRVSDGRNKEAEKNQKTKRTFNVQLTASTQKSANDANAQQDS